VPEIYLTKDEFALLTKLLESFEPEEMSRREKSSRLLKFPEYFFAVEIDERLFFINNSKHVKEVKEIS